MKTLTHADAKGYYDRLGKLQDSQGFYEDKAVKEMVDASAFEDARAIFELGSGTGRHAASILERHPARYVGVDVSETMVELSRARLNVFDDATVELTDGASRFPAYEDASFDRVMSTYVLDLLSDDQIAEFVDESARLLMPGGRLSLVSLHDARAGLSRAICSAWRAVHWVSPKILGGCRPVSLLRFVESDARFTVTHHEVLSAFGIPSEVVVATTS